MHEQADRVERRVASTSQRRTFVMACRATLVMRQLVALVLALTEAHPVRRVGTPAPAAAHGPCGFRAEPTVGAVLLS